MDHHVTAAARMPINQPKLSRLVLGKLDDISQAKLEDCLRALGHDIEIGLGGQAVAPWNGSDEGAR